jgi:hypothetical protein
MMPMSRSRRFVLPILVNRQAKNYGTKILQPWRHRENLSRLSASCSEHNPQMTDRDIRMRFFVGVFAAEREKGETAKGVNGCV